MFQGNGGYGRNGGQEMQMVLVELSARTSGIGINNAQLGAKHEQRHAQQGTNLRSDNALGRQELLIVENVVRYDSHSVAQNPPGNSPADPKRLTDIRHSISIHARNKFIGIVAIQKNRSALDRQDFKHHVQHAPLQFFRFFDPIDRRADSQNGSEIPRKAGIGRQCFRDVVLLKVHRIPAIQPHSDGRDQFAQKRISERNSRFPNLVVKQKDELRAADLDAIFVLQLLFVYRYTIHEGAVEALEVRYVDLLARISD